MTDAQNSLEKNLDPSTNPRPSKRSPMQFSLLEMMVLTTVLAILFAVMFALPPSVGAIVCLFLQPCILAACAVGAFYARDDLRAFCSGALVPFFQAVLTGGAGKTGWSNSLPAMLTQFSFNTARRRSPNQDSVTELLGNIYNQLEGMGPID